jgi:hypothetical protein
MRPRGIRVPARRVAPTNHTCRTVPAQRAPRCLRTIRGERFEFRAHSDLVQLFDAFIDWSMTGYLDIVDLGRFGTCRLGSESQSRDKDNNRAICLLESVKKSQPTPSDMVCERREIVVQTRWERLILTIAGEVGYRHWRSAVDELIPPYMNELVSRELRRLYRGAQVAHGQLSRYGVATAVRTMENLCVEVFANTKGYDHNLLGELACMPYPSFRFQGYATWLERFQEKVEERIRAKEHPRNHLLALCGTHAIQTGKLTRELLSRLVTMYDSFSRDGYRVLRDLTRLSSQQISVYSERLNLILANPTGYTDWILAEKRLPKGWTGKETVDCSRIQRDRSSSNKIARRLHRVFDGLARGYWCDLDRELSSVWLDWIESWPALSLSEQEQRRWSECLETITRLVRLDRSVLSRYKGWLISLARELRRQPELDLDVKDPISCDAYRRLALFRRIAGYKTPVTRRLSRFLFVNQRREQERSYLSELISTGALAGEASRGATQRLAYLQAKPRVKTYTTKRTRKSLRQASMEALLKITNAWVTKQSICILNKQKITWSRPLTDSEKSEFIGYLHHLSHGTRKMLIAGLQARANHPEGHRTWGVYNQQWLAKHAHQFRLNAWLDPSPRQATILVGKSLKQSTTTHLTISLSNDPLDVLWMGRPFSSCLDLRGGMKCASATANWMDANKQLLVVKDRQGRMVARKLLALTNEMTLLGYEIYSSLEEPPDSSMLLCHQIDSYCIDLANRLNVTKASEGVPQGIHGSQWYDDGAAEWKDLNLSAQPSS